MQFCNITIREIILIAMKVLFATHYLMNQAKQLTDPRAIQKLTETLKGTYIHKNAQYFCRVSTELIWDSSL